ncbi:MAG: acyl-CoA thioesterase [Alphaproteobacteria bacterium]|jgi:acyl-CoA thioester hydrolase|nr:acyl-CoA thioesterase [Alphaproteobacteria bacterium]
MIKNYINQYEKLNGFMDGKTHCISARVYYQDLDCAGIVFHANYLKFAERGRNEFWNIIDADVPADEVKEVRSVGDWALIDVNMKFKKPARLNESIMILTNVKSFNGLKVEFHQEIRHINEDGSLGDILVEVNPTLVFMMKDSGRAARAPKVWRDVLSKYIV